MRFPLNIGPLDTAFPLYKRPRLTVIARGRGMPDVTRSPVLTIEVANVARVPVEVSGVYVSFRYMNALVEVAFGKRTVKLPLCELEGELRLPCVLGVGESVTWTANLYQLRRQLEERQLTLVPHVDIDRGRSYGRLAVMIRNRIAMLGSRDLAVAVRDDRGSLYKTEVRWEPPRGRRQGPDRRPPRA